MPEEIDTDKFSDAQEVADIASLLIPNYHPEIATARIQYLFTAKAPKKGGRELVGKVSKVSGRWEYLTDLDFIVEVPASIWSESDVPKRQALVDHLLEHCTSEEDEKTGNLKWLIRDPDVREFTTILERHGCWNETLASFVTVAQSVDMSSIADVEMSDVVEEDITVEED